MPVEPGLSATVSHVVSDEDTAVAVGSGEVPVLATPRVLAIAEQATLGALAGRLEPGTTTVAVRVSLDHVAPSPVGDTVTAEATVEKVEGRRVIFTVSVSDARGLIAAGRVTRVVVDTERFMAKCR